MAPQKTSPAATPDFIPDGPAATDTPDFIPDSPPQSNAPSDPPVGLVKSIQDSFDQNTATNPGEPLGQTYLKRVVGALGSPLVHPLDTLRGMTDLIPSNPDVSGPTNQPNNPIVSRGGEAARDYQQGGLPYAATKLAGDVTGAALGGKVAEAGVGAVQGAADAAANVRSNIGNPAPNYVHSVEQNVRTMVQSLNLPTSYVEPLVNDLMGPNHDGSTAGIVRQYAAKAGKDIQSPLDFAKVAHTAGTELLDHFKGILAPIAEETEPVAQTGSQIGFGDGGRATIQSIADRITQINKQLRKAQAAKAAGNPSPLANEEELDNEARGLNSVLYDAIEKHTGIPQSDIGNLRQQYGKLFSARDNLTRAQNGIREAATNPPKSIAEAIGKVVDKTRGGQEGVFNRRFRGTLPDLPTTDPTLPTPPTTTPAMTDAARLNQLQAQEQFLHSNNLEQAAQDLAANRAEQAAIVRRQRFTNRVNAATPQNVRPHPLANNPIQ